MKSWAAFKSLQWLQASRPPSAPIRSAVFLPKANQQPAFPPCSANAEHRVQTLLSSGKTASTPKSTPCHISTEASKSFLSPAAGPKTVCQAVPESLMFRTASGTGLGNHTPVEEASDGQTHDSFPDCIWLRAVASIILVESRLTAPAGRQRTTEEPNFAYPNLHTHDGRIVHKSL